MNNSIGKWDIAVRPHGRAGRDARSTDLPVPASELFAVRPHGRAGRDARSTGLPGPASELFAVRPHGRGGQGRPLYRLAWACQ
jgi:hypothetical protein